MASLLKKYDDASKSANFDSYTSQARTWFTKNVASLTRVNRQALLRDDKAISRSRFLGGRLYQFVYDPKTKDTLLYYDKFPLSIMLEKAEFGIYRTFLENVLTTVNLQPILSTIPSMFLSGDLKN